MRCEFKCSIKTGLSVYLNIVRNISLTLIQTEWNILKNDLSTMQTHENQSAKKKKKVIESLRKRFYFLRVNTQRYCSDGGERGGFSKTNYTAVLSAPEEKAKGLLTANVFSLFPKGLAGVAPLIGVFTGNKNRPLMPSLPPPRDSDDVLVDRKSRTSFTTEQIVKYRNKTGSAD